ncbi:non-structural maintenance of chromosomes element 1 homolog [Phymastichus coffea]|uniref:non-structural maintenance of chromosomes element 1 homolog n=1 Tax=Phymastichus coffea TaxID=108790 RepID=UPI00273AD2D3|nr:non-structural maintenance of chromosomes element 1 homolog [Phymastichus coffea]
MVYDNRHRVFLQAIMQGGAVLDQTAKTMFIRIFRENLDMSSTISVINDKLSTIAMSMKTGMCEITGQTYWCVVGTLHEDSIKIPCEFSKAQQAFLKEVYSQIINADDGCISSIDCLRLIHNLDTKFTATDAESFLKNVTRNKWLHCQNGFYYMGIRSIIELMPYFRATYENFHNCHLCKDVLFYGFKCEHCNKTYHFYCISRKIAAQQEDKCPNCFENMDCSEIIEFNNTQNLNETQNEENKDEPMDVSDDAVISQPFRVQEKSKRKTRNNK